MPAGPVVYNFLFVSQVAKIGADHWSKLVVAGILGKRWY